MSNKTLPKALNRFVRSVPAKLTTIAEFPPGFFLENLAVRSYNSLLVSVLNQRELWFAPSPERVIPIEPLKLSTLIVLKSLGAHRCDTEETFSVFHWW